MSESIQHEQCLRGAEAYIRELAALRADIVVYRDVREALPGSRPPLIGGFRPDIFIRLWQDSSFFIGEAKSAGDITSPRTRSQIAAFLAEVERDPLGNLVLCVPFTEVPTARALLSELGAYNAAVGSRVFCIAPNFSTIDQAVLVK